jgi:hypothetical protein
VTESGSVGSLFKPIFGFELAEPEAIFLMKSPVMTLLIVDIPMAVR